VQTIDGNPNCWFLSKRPQQHHQAETQICCLAVFIGGEGGTNVLNIGGAVASGKALSIIGFAEASRFVFPKKGVGMLRDSMFSNADLTKGFDI
jgi:hypothetical protein